MELIAFNAPIDIEAAASGDKGPPKFSMMAYGGGPMRVAGWRQPVAIDLNGLTIPNGSVPIRFNHDAAHGVGHADKIEKTGGKLTASGIISRATPAAAEVVASSKNGFKWQASVGVTPQDYESIGPDESRVVNGQKISGPFIHVTKSMLSEISFVDLGADSSTSANVTAARAAQNKEREQMDEKDVLTAERERVTAVVKATAKHPDIQAKAIHEGWTVDRAELECHRQERADWTKKSPPAIIAGSMDGRANPDMLEACVTWHLFGEKTVEKRHGAQVAEMVKAHRPTSIVDICAMWAKAEGVNYHSTDGLIRAAMSTISMPNALETSIQKQLLEIYQTIPNTCLKVAKVRDSKTFRAETELRPTAFSSVLDKVGAHGEIKTARLGENNYPISGLNTFARGFTLSRHDIVNDDLGVLQKVPALMGEAAARTLGDAFWKFVMSPSSYFSTGNKNKATGVGSALQSSSMITAIAAFRNRLDQNGGNIYMPLATLVVGSSNEFTAKGLLRSIEVEQYVTSSSPTQPRSNVLADSVPGLEVEPRLENAVFAGNSATAWYLFSTPDKAPFFISFLSGQRTPILAPVGLGEDQQVGGLAWQILYDFQIDAGDTNAAYFAAGA